MMKLVAISAALLFGTVGSLSSQAAQDIQNANLQGEWVSICLQQGEALHWAATKLGAAAGADTMLVSDARFVSSRDGFTQASPLQPEVTALSQRGSFAFDGGTWRKMGLPVFDRPEKLEQVGQIESTPIYQRVGITFQPDVWVPVAPCVFQRYRNPALHHPM